MGDLFMFIGLITVVILALIGLITVIDKLL